MAAGDSKRTYASNAVLYALFVAGAIVVLNLISTRVFGRIDLTEKKVYTLSQPSRDLVKKLPDYLTVKAFMSADLPPELRLVSRYVRDLIDEYRTSSNGKFRWEAIDPGTDKKVEEEAGRCKIQKLQIQVLRSQKFEIGSYYLGLCFTYGDKVEAIPQVARPEGLEYQVSSLIKRMTQRKRKIAFSTGHGESDSNQGFQSLKQDLEQEYDVTTVNPATGEIAGDIDMLVVGGPRQAYDDKGQREIDRFLMTGKGAIFLLDGMAMGSPQGGNPEMAQIQMAQPNETGLGKLLEGYGFKLYQDFVFDREVMAGPLDLGGRRVLFNGPMFVAAATEKASDLSVLEGLRGIVFPYASSLELIGPLAGGKPPSGAKLWKLAGSSPRSWRHTGFFVLSANTRFEESKEKGPFALGYAYQGVLKSAFGSGQNMVESTADGKTPSESKRPVRLVVIGDSDFAKDEYVQLSRFLPYWAAGAQMLYNAIGWTVEDEGMTPLRAKSLDPRPLKVSSDAVASAVQWGNILGLPVAFCLFGIVRWRLQRLARQGHKL